MLEIFNPKENQQHEINVTDGSTPEAEDFPRLVKRLEAFKAFRPRLNVVGQFDHFKPSVLGQVAQGCLDVRSVTGPDQVADPVPNEAWIRWAPHSRYAIPTDLRAAVPASAHIINDTHFNCDKRSVSLGFERVFGYSVGIDPLAHVGEGVAKSRQNAAHDGRIMRFPIEAAKPGTAYERVVNNQVGNYVCDFRVPIVLGRIPFIYLKFRPHATRFSNTNSWARICSPLDVMSPGELRSIVLFSQHIGLEYGELDVLRDLDEGRIYVVDANNTPYGPPNGLAAEARDLAIRLLRYCILDRVFRLATP
ncbi:hypothetical protein ACLF3G_10725 [Falsiroseomonas sp. HC035]|uniref:hypothetical protein n=1 Tax=Falsiroseomonas sp. HC035 TaxID=3390999 RepID=UPI003D31F056